MHCSYNDRYRKNSGRDRGKTKRVPMKCGDGPCSSRKKRLKNRSIVVIGNHVKSKAGSLGRTLNICGCSKDELLSMNKNYEIERQMRKTQTGADPWITKQLK